MACTFNPRTQEAEAGKSLRSRPARATVRSYLKKILIGRRSLQTWLVSVNHSREPGTYWFPYWPIQSLNMNAYLLPVQRFQVQFPCRQLMLITTCNSSSRDPTPSSAHTPIDFFPKHREPVVGELLIIY